MFTTYNTVFTIYYLVYSKEVKKLNTEFKNQNKNILHIVQAIQNSVFKIIVFRI